MSLIQLSEKIYPNITRTLYLNAHNITAVYSDDEDTIIRERDVHFRVAENVHQVLSIIEDALHPIQVVHADEVSGPLGVPEMTAAMRDAADSVNTYVKTTLTPATRSANETILQLKTTVETLNGLVDRLTSLFPQKN